MLNQEQKAEQPTETGMDTKPLVIRSYLAGDKCPICGMQLNQKVQVPTCGNVQTGVISPNGGFKVEGKVECPYGLR